ncbi:MAG: T9SS type A sorting domain-containing protein [Bacteroidales bacterium]|nr:T9SS type A sorting domain-containing protein [Bacteroidales bacterium]
MKKTLLKVKTNLLQIIPLITILFLSSVALGQSETSSSVRLLEHVDDPYISSPASTHATSPAYKYFTTGFFTVQANVDFLGQNIVGDAANEPSITFDPTDPSRMAIGWRHFETTTNNFRQAGIAYTTDAGQTWTFTDVIDPGIFRSDPVLDCDAEGTFYYNSLTKVGQVYNCDVFKSFDGGATWDGGTFAQGGDKQWMAIDKTSGIGSGNIYSNWTAYWSYCYPDFFTRSVDGGMTYEDCTYIPGEPHWGTTMVYSNGDVYIGGAQGSNFMFARSSNAKDPAQTPSWDLVTSVNLGGEIVGFGGYSCPNPSGLLGQAIISADSSGGPYDGYIYILCSVQRYSPWDPCDVMFTRSTDGGNTWENPVRVNDDPGSSDYQWFGTMSVAPDGRIDVVWLDTRDSPGSTWSALYYANSIDGGETWSVNEKLSDTFDSHTGWPDQEKMGDYFDMFSDETGAHLAWANTLNGEQDVYYAHITPSVTGIDKRNLNSSVSLSQNYPNPVRENTAIRYSLTQKQHINLSVFDMTGRVIETLVDEIKEMGSWQVNFNTQGHPGGMYYYTLHAGEFRETRKLMILD